MYVYIQWYLVINAPVMLQKDEDGYLKSIPKLIEEAGYSKPATNLEKMLADELYDQLSVETRSSQEYSASKEKHVYEVDIHEDPDRISQRNFGSKLNTCNTDASKNGS